MLSFRIASECLKLTLLKTLLIVMLLISGRITPASPTIFRPGDIIELTIEFCAFPSASKIIPILQLKALRMLFPDHRNVCDMFHLELS